MKIQMFRKYIFLRCRTMNNGFLVSTDNVNNNNPGSRVIVRILRIEMSYTGIIKDLFPEDTSSFVKDLIAISQWKCQLKRFHSVAHVTIYCAIRATILCYNVTNGKCDSALVSYLSIGRLVIRYKKWIHRRFLSRQC